MAGHAGSAAIPALSSRALRGGEPNYSATKLELLGIVGALNKFRHYLYGTRFTLYTDHQALVYLYTSKMPNPMMQNWYDTLSEFDFDIVHLPGLSNVLPDHLSRLYPEHVYTPAITKVPANFGMKAMKLMDTLEEITDTAEQIRLIDQEHLKGHFGVAAVLKGLRQQGYTWPRMQHSIRDHIGTCMECAKFTIVAKGFAPMRTISATLPMDHAATDYIGPFPTTPEGWNYLLLVLCLCTRFVFLFPMKTKLAAEVAQELFRLFCLVGFPKILQSDNGREFVNEICNHLNARAGIDHRVISTYHPRANGAGERYVQTTKAVIKKQLQGEQQRWAQFAPATQYFMNTKVAHLHGSTPFSLMFARPHNLFRDYRRDPESKVLTEEELTARVRMMTDIVFPAIKHRTQRTQERMKRIFDSTANLREFPVGSMVMWTDPHKDTALDRPT